MQHISENCESCKWGMKFPEKLIDYFPGCALSNKRTGMFYKCSAFTPKQDINFAREYTSLAVKPSFYINSKA